MKKIKPEHEVYDENVEMKSLHIVHKRDLFFLLISTFLVGILFDRLLITFFGSVDLHWFGIVLGVLINGRIAVFLFKKILLSKKD